jgi:hypothetical protein
VHVRLDRKATSISLFVVLGVRRNGQKVLLAVRNMGGESEAAWRALLDDLIDRGPKTPEFLIIGPNTASARLGPARPRAIGWNGVGDRMERCGRLACALARPAGDLLAPVLAGGE